MQSHGLNKLNDYFRVPLKTVLNSKAISADWTKSLEHKEVSKAKGKPAVSGKIKQARPWVVATLLLKIHKRIHVELQLAQSGPLRVVGNVRKTR